MIDRARDSLEREMHEAGKGKQYQALAEFHSGEGAGKPYGQVAAALGTSEASVKMSVLRLRRRFGRILRDEIAATVRDPRDIDDEVRHLLAVARGA